MALIDRARDVYFDRAKERWKQEGFYADITDILDDYREETNKKIARNRENVLITFLISLYDYDHDSLQLDITKLIVLSPSSEFPAKDKRKLLQILLIMETLLHQIIIHHLEILLYQQIRTHHLQIQQLHHQRLEI